MYILALFLLSLSTSLLSLSLSLFSPAGEQRDAAARGARVSPAETYYRPAKGYLELIH